MRRLVSLLSVAAMATALLVIAPASPASANGVCVGALGSATLGAGLTYPNPLVTPSLGRVATGFFVSFNPPSTCVNVTGGTAVQKGLTATGGVDGWCGHSTGSGVTNTGQTFHWTSAGSFLVLTGSLTGLVNAVPDAVNGESCSPLGPGADVFLVSGVALKLHCSQTVEALPFARICVPTALP